MVYLEPYLYSSTRKNKSDGQIIIWSSPNTKVLHNTVRTNGNTNKSIKLRFASGGAEVVNNLTDAPIVYREGFSFSNVDNATITGANIFVDEANADLHLVEQFGANFLTGTRHPDAPKEFDGQDRGVTLVYVGADSLVSSGPPVTGTDNINLSHLFLLLFDEDNQSE